MVQPTPEEWAVLRPMERLGYRLGDFFSRRAPWLSSIINTTWMVAVVWFCAGRRFRLHGLEHLAPLRRDDRVLYVANHRTFFDFFVVMCSTWLHSTAPRRIVMPVRSTFFYTSPLGPLINLLMSGYSMFPPVLRDEERGRVFNKFSQARMIEEMARPGTVMGMHPEGTRNRGSDPYALLDPKPGCGRIARKVPGLTVIPVFVVGMGNRLAREAWLNWTSAGRHPIDLVYGAPIELSDLTLLPDEHETHMRIVERMMEALRSLAEAQRALAARRIAGQ